MAYYWPPATLIDGVLRENPRKTLTIKRPSVARFLQARRLFELGRVKIRGREIIITSYCIGGRLGVRAKDLHIEYIILK